MEGDRIYSRNDDGKNISNEYAPKKGKHQYQFFWYWRAPFKMFLLSFTTLRKLPIWFMSKSFIKNFFQQILVENNKIQKTENREGVKISKRTKFYHFYWKERTWRAGEAFPLYTWKKQKVRERDVTNAWAEVMFFGFPWFWLVSMFFTMDFPFSLFTNISLNAKHFSLRNFF